MNLIDNIEIKNFKSIRHQKIEGCKRVNVFIGYPNVGKSNILEALALFSINKQVKLKDLVRLKETPTIFFNGYIENELMVSVNDEYGVLGEYSENEFSLEFQKKGKGIKFNKIKSIPVVHPLLVKKIKFRDFIYSGSRDGLIVNDADYFTVKKYEFRNNTEKSNANYSFLQYPFGNNLFSILQTNEKLYTDASELLKENGLELLYDSREQQFTILKRTGSKIFTVPYELLADTLQRVIFYKAAIYSNKGNILIFEEPEAHMFPPYIAKFTTDIIFDKTENQYFIATHSPFVLNDFMEDMERDDLSVYVVGLKDGETIINRLTDDEFAEVNQYGVDLFFNLESYLKDGSVNNA